MSEHQTRPHHLDFNLQKMEHIYDQAAGKADVPHRHDYYTVLFVERGKGEHLIDYKPYAFGERQVHFVSPGQVHQVALTAKPKGWVITFSADFLVANNIPSHFIANVNLFRVFGDSPPLILDEHNFDRLCELLQSMERLIPQQLRYQNRALGAYLQLFLIHSSNSRFLDEEQLDETSNSEVCILRDFKHLVDHSYHQWHKVGDYAEEMHISPKHLSQTVKKNVGQTAKEMIQDRLLLEAKRMLIHTDYSVKEIAYELGYHEPLHFSAFFKKQMGISASAYRTKQ
ncbi:MAG: helix-turn-helix transcriptional regulator [Bacteroidota bacterium]